MEGAVKEMVQNLKYRNVRALAPELGRLMAAHLESERVPADVLVPVPLHRRRERERGYNQSDLLAEEAGGHLGVPVESGLLRRTRDTAPQVSVSGHQQRRQNIEGAFQASADVRGLRVLVIDDVVTTGSTMSACASALKAAGASPVWGLALARQG
jgi:ComF family protein